MPRPRRKAPRRFDDSADPVRFESPKQIFHQHYCEIINHAESAIRRRFEQPGIDLACTIKRILTQVSTGQSEVNCKLVNLLPPKTDMFSNGLHSFAGLPVCSQQVSFICWVNFYMFGCQSFAWNDSSRILCMQRGMTFNEKEVIALSVHIYCGVLTCN